MMHRDNAVFILITILFGLTWFFIHMHSVQVMEAVAQHNESAHIVVTKHYDETRG